MPSDLQSDRSAPALAPSPIPAGDVGTWRDVCALGDLIPGTGAAALVDGRQVAIVRMPDGDTVYAVDHFDPFSRAFVIARGIVGDKAGVPKIASPIYKQTFDLRTGACLDDPAVALPCWPARVRDGRVQILWPRAAGEGRADR